MANQRLVLSYDDEADPEIHSLVTSIKHHRRSEVVRGLIKAALAQQPVGATIKMPPPLAEAKSVGATPENPSRKDEILPWQREPQPQRREPNLDGIL